MSNYNIEPFPIELYKQAINLDIEAIALKFEGGNDEGLLDVDYLVKDNKKLPREIIVPLLRQIEYWAHNAYPFSGAGDGDRYGFDVYYNLQAKIAHLTEWYDVVERHEKEAPTKRLPIRLPDNKVTELIDPKVTIDD